MLLSVLAVGLAAPVAAVGPNQNDLNSGGDLPDNTSVNITNYIFTSTYTGSGELDYGDDNDILKVALSANEGLSATLSFPSSTSFPNGSTTYNDFDLYFYDSQLNTMGSSWGSNLRHYPRTHHPLPMAAWSTSIFLATAVRARGI